MIKRLALISAAVLLATAGAVLAQTAKTAPAAKAPVPVNIEADQMEILDAQKKAVFRGNVVAVRGDVTLKSSELTVIYADVKQPDGTSKTDATDLDAKGAVNIKTPRETITGDWARFDPQANTLVVGGAVKLVQGATVLQGKELRADLDTDKVQMSGGRVKGSFLPQ
jgi:lipopolysaccharide export system protein LptA